MQQNIKFRCDNCAQSLNASIKMVGMYSACPVCKSKIKVPDIKKREQLQQDEKELVKIRFRCIDCSQLLIASIHMIGYSFPCPVCKKQVLIEPNKEQYVSECLRHNYIELNETRRWNSIPALQRVIEPLNSWKNEIACHEAEELIAQYPDFSTLYAWCGIALTRMNLFDKARHVLRDGLRRGKEKHSLCNHLGEIEWKNNILKMAVYWWVQGLLCQESLKSFNYGGSESNYLYLNYVAEGRQLHDYSKAFLRRVDSIKSGMVRLDTETANNLFELSYFQGTQEIELLLKEVISRYFLE